MIYNRDDRHKDMLINNLEFMKRFDYVVREYDSNLPEEDISLLSLSVSRDSSNSLKEFLPLFKEYVKKSKKYLFTDEEVVISEKLFRKE